MTSEQSVLNRQTPATIRQFGERMPRDYSTCKVGPASGAMAWANG